MGRGSFFRFPWTSDRRRKGDGAENRGVTTKTTTAAAAAVATEARGGERCEVMKRTLARVSPRAQASKSLTVSFPSRSFRVPKPSCLRSQYVMFSDPMVPAFLLWRLPPPRGMVADGAQRETSRLAGERVFGKEGRGVGKCAGSRADRK